MKEELIAPCGMNCGICISYLAMKNELNKKGLKRVYCEGCLPRGKNCLHMGNRCQVICCHIGLCLNCKLDTLRQNRKYRWDQE